jgi:hypothetical protein
MDNINNNYVVTGVLLLAVLIPTIIIDFTMYIILTYYSIKYIIENKTMNNNNLKIWICYCTIFFGGYLIEYSIQIPLLIYICRFTKLVYLMIIIKKNDSYIMTLFDNIILKYYIKYNIHIDNFVTHVEKIINGNNNKKTYFSYVSSFLGYKN